MSNENEITLTPQDHYQFEDAVQITLGCFAQKD